MTPFARCLAPLSALALGLPLAAQAPPGPSAPPSAPSVALMMKGDVLDPIFTRGLNDVDYTLDFPKQGPTTLLLFFVSACPHCQAMIPYWNEAVEKKPKDLKVVGVMLDEGSQGFFELYKLKFPVLKALQPTPLSRRLKISRVPLTARVLPGGIVEEVLTGDPDPPRIARIFRAPGT